MSTVFPNKKIREKASVALVQKNSKEVTKRIIALQELGTVNLGNGKTVVWVAVPQGVSGRKSYYGLSEQKELERSSDSDPSH